MRYFIKSTNFALCYIGFSPSKDFYYAFPAGKAAFLCCAYDVITDWRKFNPSYLIKYKAILASIVPTDLVELSLRLYDAEINNDLQRDGLERGVIALVSVTRLMGVEQTLRDKTNIEELGILLQIVDDVLDYEHDLKNNELNCLMSNNANKYIGMLIEKANDTEINRLFPYGFLLKYVIRTAREKAEFLMLRDQQGEHYTLC